MLTREMVVGSPMLVVQSKMCVRSNESILAVTRYRIAANRRRLNPAFAFAGASDDDTRALVLSIRARLASGALFPVGPKVHAGYGSGHDCVVCRIAVGRIDVEYEIPLGRGIAVVAHLRCYLLWRTESVRREAALKLARLDGDVRKSV